MVFIHSVGIILLCSDRNGCNVWQILAVNYYITLQYYCFMLWKKCLVHIKKSKCIIFYADAVEAPYLVVCLESNGYIKYF